MFSSFSSGEVVFAIKVGNYWYLCLYNNYYWTDHARRNLHFQEYVSLQAGAIGGGEFVVAVISSEDIRKCVWHLWFSDYFMPTMIFTELEYNKSCLLVKYMYIYIYIYITIKMLKIIVMYPIAKIQLLKQMHFY